MASIPFDKFNLNRFWEKTPNTLKYVLIFTIFLTVVYFIMSKKMDDNHLQELDSMKTGIVATYQLIDNFEEFRKEQDAYNKEVLNYLKNLHTLVEELNATTNRKFDILMNSGNRNAGDIIEKIQILNESFERVSKVYESSFESPNLDDNKVKKTYDLNGVISVKPISPDSIEK